MQLLTGCRCCARGRMRPLGENPCSGGGAAPAPVLVIVEVPLIPAEKHALAAALGSAGLADHVRWVPLVRCEGAGMPDYRELEACVPFLRDEVRVCAPSVLMCMGQLVVQRVLHTDSGVATLRGRMHRSGRFMVVPTWSVAQATTEASCAREVEHDCALLAGWLQEQGLLEGTKGVLTSADTNKRGRKE